VTPTQIRPALLRDVEEIARLAGELGYPTPAAAMAERLVALLGDRRHHIVVAEAGAGRLHGWAHVEHRQSLEGGRRAELVGLVVAAAARRRAIGRRLVAAIEAWAASQGLPSLVVRSNVARRESHAFYRSLGYAHDKTQHVYVKRRDVP